MPSELVGHTPPEPGTWTPDDAYHVAKINAAKSVSHKTRIAALSPEQAAERQAKIAAGVTPEVISARAAGAKAAWANKTPEERAAWRARCRAVKAGSKGNIENLRKGWSPEVHAKAIEASAEARRGTEHTEEHKAKIADGLARSYAEGRRRRGHTEETKRKISETKRARASK